MSTQEEKSSFSDDVLCLITEYACYKEEKSVIQSFHQRFTMITPEEQKDLTYYSSAKKRFLLVGIKGYLCETDNENPNALDAIGSFEELTRESYNDICESKGFCSVYKAFKIQSILHFIRAGDFDIEYLKKTLKKLTNSVKIHSPAKDKTTDKYKKIISQIEEDNITINRRFESFFKEFSNPNKSKKREAVQKLINEFPYANFKQEIKKFLNDFAQNMPLPLLEMVDRGMPIAFKKDVRIEATNLVKVIPTEELKAIHSGDDKKLKRWIAQNDMNDKLVFTKPRQSSYIAYLQHIKSQVEDEDPSQIKVSESNNENSTLHDHFDDDVNNNNNNNNNNVQNAVKKGTQKRKLVEKTVQNKKVKNEEDLYNSDASVEEEDEDNIKTQIATTADKKVKSSPTTQPPTSKSSTSPLSNKKRIGVTLTGQRKRRKWEDREVELLMEGVRLFGTGNWAAILNSFDFGDRTYVDLKDKFRNLRKKYTLEELLGVDVKNDTSMDDSRQDEEDSDEY